MNNQSTNSVIPEGEVPCVWMDAGISSFKLCDQELRCETCAFHRDITQQNKETLQSDDQDETPRSFDSRAMTAETLFHTMLKKRLDQLRRIDIPRERIYHGQFWIEQNAPGIYRVGINHILANFFQPILSVVISKAPANINRHDPFCWIILPGGAITMRSPLEATIIRFNPALQQKPNLLSTAPFDDGWIMEITAKSKGLSSFVSSNDSHRLMKRTLRNVEHIFNQTYRHFQPSTGTTLFDGGISSASLESTLGPIVYREVVNRITHFPL